MLQVGSHRWAAPECVAGTLRANLSLTHLASFWEAYPDAPKLATVNLMTLHEVIATMAHTQCTGLPY